MSGSGQYTGLFQRRESSPTTSQCVASSLRITSKKPGGVPFCSLRTPVRRKKWYIQGLLRSLYDYVRSIAAQHSGLYWYTVIYVLGRVSESAYILDQKRCDLIQMTQCIADCRTCKTLSKGRGQHFLSPRSRYYQFLGSRCLVTTRRSR
jgi:hypothetical protein